MPFHHIQLDPTYYYFSFVSTICSLHIFLLCTEYSAEAHTHRHNPYASNSYTVLPFWPSLLDENVGFRFGHCALYLYVCLNKMLKMLSAGRIKHINNNKNG